LDEKLTYEELEQRVMQLEKDNSEFKRLEDALKNRIVALTLPLNDYGSIAFEDLFNIDDIQRIQDEFAKVTGVASIITHTDGTPITAPSNFCRLCKDIIRKTDMGLANCLKSDAVIGQYHPGGPIIQPCMSGGLWDAGAGITVGGRHIANWLIGQVRDELQTEDKMLLYAREIATSEEAVIEAFREVPAMSREQFGHIAKFLFTLANQLSTTAYQNVQQARFITERKRTEEKIQRNESRLRRLLDILQHPSQTIQDFLDYALDQAIQLTESKIGYIYHYDENSRKFVLNTWSKEVMTECTVANPSNCYALDMTGIWGEAVRQRRPIIVNDFQAANPLKKGYPEGHVQLVKFMTVPIFKNDCIVGVVGVANKGTDYEESDILQVSLLMEAVWKVTERKLSEEALQTSRRQLTDIVEFLPDATLAIDKEKRIIIWNKAIEKMTGVPAAEMIGKGDYAYTIPFYGEARPQLMDLIFMDHGDIVARYPNINREGDSITAEVFCNALYNNKGAWVFAKASPLHDPSGNIVGAIESIRDITERKQAEDEKEKIEAQNRLLQKTESLGRMAGAIAHHFNNQLQAVMGNLEMAMLNLKLGANPIVNLESAMQATHKAAEVSALMLTYLGKTHDKHEPIDLPETCRQSQTLLHVAIPKGIILKTNIPSFGLVIRANAGQIRQVLTNLITNAWEGADRNQGNIGLTVKTVSQEDIPASKRFPIDWQPQESIYACIEVTDTGCGIESKDIEKIFDPFFTTKFTGRGMGLSVVLGIVRAHHGGITAESEPGRGSVFRVFLPVSTGEILLQQENTAQVTTSESTGTVLVVEDEIQVRDMVKEMLISMGFSVLEARDGIEAIGVFRQHQDEIRCVVCDLTMPRMDGWDTLAALRKLSPDIAVILSSGYDEAQVMAGEHPDRPNAFLGKPYQMKGLRDTISRVLANKA